MKFKDKYVSQTQIAELFGMTSVELGKILMQLGLRDRDRMPTAVARERHLTVYTPLKNGTPHVMWGKYATVKLLTEAGHALLNEEDLWYVRTKNALHEAARLDNGSGKLQSIAYDCAIDDVPEHLRDKIIKRICAG